MKVKGDGERHIADTRRLLGKVIAACSFDNLGKLNADALDAFLADLTRPDGQSCSARTKNSYRQAVLGFANWCVKKRKLSANPLLWTTRPEGNTRIERRALSLPQLQCLLEVARVRPPNEKLIVRFGPNKGRLVARVRPEVRAGLEEKGRQRVLLYKCALYTGLRRGELRSLRVRHLCLDGPNPKLTLPGEFTKNHKPAIIPLRLDLAEELRSWIDDAGRSTGDSVFSVGRDVAKHL